MTYKIIMRLYTHGWGEWMSAKPYCQLSSSQAADSALCLCLDYVSTRAIWELKAKVFDAFYSASA